MTASTATTTQRASAGEAPVFAGSSGVPLRVAVVVASRHGATVGIAEAIRGQLTSAGLRARLFVAEDFDTFEGADAVVLGSAVYAGHWLKSARELLDQHRSELAELPVWLFSSGPVGEEPLAGAELPPAIERAAEEIGAREHRLFSGKIDPELLGFGERTIVKALRAPNGDFRDWGAISAWADEIASSLGQEPVASEPAGPYIQAGAVT